MGKKSVKENKNIYQISREEAELTREKAGEMMEFISPDRIEKIESEKSFPHPDEVLVMAECYKKPELINYYCTHNCPIGKVHVPEIEVKDLTQLALEVLASLNELEKQKNRLIEISVDGKINPGEYEDFSKIKGQLDKIALTTNSMSLWVEKMMALGKIEVEEE